jgi:hypothetical protein
MRRCRVSDFLSGTKHYGILAMGALLAGLTCSPASADGSGLRFDSGAEWRESGLIEPMAHPLSPFYGSSAATYEDWHLTVRYALIDLPSSQFALGMTARGRDNLDWPGHFDSAPTTLLHAHGEYRLGLKWSVAGDVDTDARPGRNLDLGVRVAYDLSPVWSMSAGYRMIDQPTYVDPNSVTRGNWLTFGTRVRF